MLDCQTDLLTREIIVYVMAYRQSQSPDFIDHLVALVEELSEQDGEDIAKTL